MKYIVWNNLNGEREQFDHYEDAQWRVDYLTRDGLFDEWAFIQVVEG